MKLNNPRTKKSDNISTFPASLSSSLRPDTLEGRLEGGGDGICPVLDHAVLPTLGGEEHHVESVASGHAELALLCPETTAKFHEK